MSDPKRWMEEGADAAPHERALLRAGLDMKPPAGAEDAIWAALSAQIGPGGGGGDGGGGDGGSVGGTGAPMGAPAPAATASASTASATGVVGATKAIVVGLLGTTIVAGALAVIVPAKEPPPAAPRANPTAEAAIEAPRAPELDVPPASSTPTPAPVAVDEAPKSPAPRRVSSALPAASVSPKAPPAPSASVEPEATRAERASRLREERTALGDARAALRSGDTAGAFQKLEAMGDRFPSGTLAQEREALAIEALARAGQSAAASERAAAFLRAHPTSPHATKIRGFLR
ncbi:outer membrane protein assembly factor BamD [Polyangium sorediatum]|uniref:Outer membrane protein assembly factor BamD n=1 Tax=Polyangium sorediatum TaxID=889274 RepID=A0ABT6NT07_9BACT|nr:outer membrane protein assembly factor BamD [Polyangium sorediatum]MDI1431475.1 outer membrane protein assembly factor BamD [Polyangium sorediatum]